MLTKVRNHGLTPQSILLDFLRSNFWSYHWTEHLMSAIYTRAGTSTRKMPLGVETSFLERESLCVCSLLPFSLDCPLPSYVATRVSHASSRGGGWERKQKWVSSRDSDGTHGGALHRHSTPLALLVDTCVRYQGKKKKKDWFGTFLKKIIFFLKGGMTKKIKMNSYLKVICLIVVHVQSSVQLTVSGYRQLFSTGDPIVDGLTCVLLHLNVVELTEIAKPLDELRGDAPVELLNLNVEKDKNIAVFSLHSLSIWNIFKDPLSSFLERFFF